MVVVEGTGYRSIEMELFKMPEGELNISKELPPNTRKCFVSKIANGFYMG